MSSQQTTLINDICTDRDMDIDDLDEYDDDPLDDGKDKKSAKGSNGRSVYQRHPKPPFSYIALIAMAIRDSPKGKLTLAEINEYLMRKFSFFRGEYQGWKNSIRHNLSLNECFIKILRDPNRPWGKDNYWTLNPSSEYTFADGVFRRRRKKLNGSCTSTTTAIHSSSKSQEIRQENSSRNLSKNERFSIENLLKTTSTSHSEKNLSAIKTSSSTANAEIQWPTNVFNFDPTIVNQQNFVQNGTIPFLYGCLPFFAAFANGNNNSGGDFFYDHLNRTNC